MNKKETIRRKIEKKLKKMLTKNKLHVDMIKKDIYSYQKNWNQPEQLETTIERIEGIYWGD